jgi:hypothetical protein
MEEAPEKGRESTHSAHANGMNELIKRNLAQTIQIIPTKSQVIQ